VTVRGRVSFQAKLLLAMVSLLAVLAGGILIGLEVIARREVPAQLSRDLDASVEVLEERFRLDLGRVATEARVVAEEPRIKAVINTPEVDDDTLKDVAAETRTSTGWDLLGLATAGGARLQFAGARLTTTPPQLAEALAGRDSAGYWVDGPAVFRVAALPVSFDQ
jgi:phosphoserine phosphatase RsbU/P